MRTFDAHDHVRRELLTDYDSDKAFALFTLIEFKYINFFNRLLSYKKSQQELAFLMSLNYLDCDRWALAQSS